MDARRSSQRLPPLNALRTFEAAGRLESIRGAAAELVVTPGAVSRQVQALESWLGVPLFRHEAKSIKLTPAGRRYLDAVSEHLGGIALATDQLTCPLRNETILAVRAYSMFGDWLVPRLSGFRRSQPWIALQLTTSSRLDDFGQHDVDAEIRPGNSSWLGYEAQLLLSDPIICVCSPAFLAEHRIEQPSDLRLLHERDFLRSLAAPTLWQRWLDDMNISGVDPDHGPVYGDSALACRAAIAGEGVMLLPATLIEAELGAGRLVAPLTANSHTYNCAADFYFVYPSDRTNRRALRAFRTWILAEVAKGPRQLDRAPR